MEEQHAAAVRWSNNLQQELSRNITCLQVLQLDCKHLSNNLGGRKPDVADEQMKLLQAHEFQSLKDNEKQQEVIKDGIVRQGEELEKIFPSIVEEWTRKESLWASKSYPAEKALRYLSQIRFMLSAIQTLDVKLRDKEEGVVTRRESAVSALSQPTLPPPPNIEAEAAAVQRTTQGPTDRPKGKGKASESTRRK